MGNSALKLTQSVSKTVQVQTQADFILTLKTIWPHTRPGVHTGRFRADLGRIFLPERKTGTLLTVVKSFSNVGTYRRTHQ